MNFEYGLIMNAAGLDYAEALDESCSVSNMGIEAQKRPHTGSSMEQANVLSTSTTNIHVVYPLHSQGT